MPQQPLETIRKRHNKKEQTKTQEITLNTEFYNNNNNNNNNNHNNNILI